MAEDTEEDYQWFAEKLQCTIKTNVAALANGFEVHRNNEEAASESEDCEEG